MQCLNHGGGSKKIMDGLNLKSCTTKNTVNHLGIIPPGKFVEEESDPSALQGSGRFVSNITEK